MLDQNVPTQPDTPPQASCPLCRKIFSEIDFNIMPWIRDYVENITYSCIHPNCTEILTRGEWTQHYKRCEFRTLSCTNSECDWRGNGKELADHKKICVYTRTLCDKCRNPYPQGFKYNHKCLEATLDRNREVEKANRNLKRDLKFAQKRIADQDENLKVANDTIDSQQAKINQLQRLLKRKKVQTKGRENVYENISDEEISKVGETTSTAGQEANSDSQTLIATASQETTTDTINFQNVSNQGEGQLDFLFNGEYHLQELGLLHR